MKISRVCRRVVIAAILPFVSAIEFWADFAKRVFEDSLQAQCNHSLSRAFSNSFEGGNVETVFFEINGNAVAAKVDSQVATKDEVVVIGKGVVCYSQKNTAQQQCGAVADTMLANLVDAADVEKRQLNPLPLLALAAKAATILWSTAKVSAGIAVGMGGIAGTCKHFTGDVYCNMRK